MKTIYLVKELTEKSLPKDAEKLKHCLMALENVLTVVLHPTTGEVSVTSSPMHKPTRSSIRSALRYAGFTLQSSQDWM